MLSACPSVQEHKGKRWNPEPHCSHSSRGGRQMGRAKSLAVSCKIVTVPLHAWSQKGQINFLYVFCTCVAKQESLTRKKICSFLCRKMLKCVKDFDVHKYTR